MKDLFVQYVSYSHIIIIALGFFYFGKNLYREKNEYYIILFIDIDILWNDRLYLLYT